MHFKLDLRYVFLPTIGLALRFLISQDNSRPQNDNFVLEFFGLPMFLLTLVIIIGVILFCLVTSVKFDLTMESLRLQTGDMSGPLAILLLASLILPLSLFWFAYLMLLILSPCSGFIFNQLDHFVKWLCRSLGATFFCIIRHQEEPEPHQPEVGIQVTEEEGMNNV